MIPAQDRKSWKVWWDSLPDHTLVLHSEMYDEIVRAGQLEAYKRQYPGVSIVRNIPVPR